MNIDDHRHDQHYNVKRLGEIFEYIKKYIQKKDEELDACKAENCPLFVSLGSPDREFCIDNELVADYAQYVNELNFFRTGEIDYTKISIHSSLFGTLDYFSNFNNTFRSKLPFSEKLLEYYDIFGIPNNQKIDFLISLTDYKKIEIKNFLENLPTTVKTEDFLKQFMIFIEKNINLIDLRINYLVKTKKFLLEKKFQEAEAIIEKNKKIYSKLETIFRNFGLYDLGIGRVEQEVKEGRKTKKIYVDCDWLESLKSIINTQYLKNPYGNPKLIESLATGVPKNKDILIKIKSLLETLIKEVEIENKEAFINENKNSFILKMSEHAIKLGIKDSLKYKLSDILLDKEKFTAAFIEQNELIHLLYLYSNGISQLEDYIKTLEYKPNIASQILTNLKFIYQSSGIHKCIQLLEKEKSKESLDKLEKYKEYLEDVLEF